MDTDELYEHIGKEGTRESTPERERRYLEHIVNSEVLPHMGLTQTEDVRRAKAFYLGYALRKLIGVYNGEIAADDRDHMSAKRVDANGTQFELLFPCARARLAKSCEPHHPHGGGQAHDQRRVALGQREDHAGHAFRAGDRHLGHSRQPCRSIERVDRRAISISQQNG